MTPICRSYLWIYPHKFDWKRGCKNIFPLKSIEWGFTEFNTNDRGWHFGGILVAFWSHLRSYFLDSCLKSLEDLLVPWLGVHQDIIEFFTVCTKFAELAILYWKDLTRAKKKLSPVALGLVQEIIAGSGVQCLTNWVKLACASQLISELLFIHHLIFGLRGTERI